VTPMRPDWDRGSPARQQSARFDAIDVAGEERPVLGNLSCPTSSFCATSDGWDYLDYEGPTIGNLIASSEPAGGAAAWRRSEPLNDGDFPVACAALGQCLTSDFSGNIYGVEAGAEMLSTTFAVEPLKYGRTLIGLACPSAEECLAIDTEGNLYTATTKPAAEGGEEPPADKPKEAESGGGIGGSSGGSAPSAPSGGSSPSGSTPVAGISSVEIATALTKLLGSVGKGTTAAGLLKHHGTTLAVSGLEAGTLGISWYGSAGGHAGAAKTVLVGSGRVRFSGAGSSTLKLRLTAAGIRVLRRVRHPHLIEKATFAPNGGAPVNATRSLALH